MNGRRLRPRLGGVLLAFLAAAPALPAEPANVLAKMEPLEERYVQKLTAWSEPTRFQATQDLSGADGEKLGKAIVGPLARALRDPSRRVRTSAACALGFTKDASAAPPLLNLLDHADSDIQMCAFYSLLRLGPLAKDAVTPLTDYLDDEEDAVRHLTVKTLGTIGPSAVAAQPELVKSFYREKNSGIREAIVTSLGQLGPAPHGTVSTLIDGLRDGDARVRAAAAIFLGRFGIAGRAAVPGLERLLTDADPTVQCAAVEALNSISPESLKERAALRSGCLDEEQ